MEERADGLELTCSRLVWAGGQQKATGSLRARFRKIDGEVEWSAVAEMEQPIKSLAAIVRGVPRGKISAGGQGFFDPRDNEVLLGYPFGGGALFIARGLNTPLVVIQTSGSQYFYLSALNQSVRANRFYFQPGEKGYRVEMVYEQAGWEKKNTMQSPVWRAGRAATLQSAFRPHFEHVEKTFAIPAWETRPDVPPWFHQIALVLALHGMHWTGYIFNDFAKMRAILQWVAAQIPARNVMVFLPAWDGRYYWNYPIYQPDPRLGGEDGFRRLIFEGQKMGFHFVPMFGTNAANSRLPEFSNFADATTSQIDGDAFNLNWVDWDNDCHNEGAMPYMNLGVDSWRRWLSGRISDLIERFHADGYFLDIAGGWENNTKADTHEGTRRLVAELAQKHPGVLAVGEMHYDALLSFIPVYHTAVETLLSLKREFPHDPEVLFIMTHYYGELANRAAQDLAAAAPDSYQAQELEAEALEAHGKWDDAAALYRKILQAHANVPGVHYHLGQMLLNNPSAASNTQEARQEFEKELRIDPSNASAEFILGELARPRRPVG